MKKKSVLLASIFSIFLSPFAWAQTQNNDTVLILDASGSMWAQLPEGRSRIEVARDVLSEFMINRDQNAPLGVIAYGHNRRGDCGDIETISPVQKQDGAALTTKLRTLNPRGKTPLAASLRRAAGEIRATSEAANIVLLTDGLETCGGDPCAVAAELAAEGIDIKAHIVGLGLSEGEISQIACVAELTGGLVLTPQNGQELADALIRTTEPVLRKAETPASAALNLTIVADIAGRPDQVSFSAENLASGAKLDLGQLNFEKATALSVDLTEGRWVIRADAGDMGHGETEITVIAGDNRTIYVPFTGLLPSLDLPLPTGDFRAGINGLLPYRITREGLATGGGDFVISVLPVDAAHTTDRRIDYSTQNVRLGSYVGLFRTPAEQGQYLIAFHRNASQNIADVLMSFVINVVDRPEVRLAAPSAVELGARIPVQISVGLGSSDRIEIWRDGARVSWDQSVYVEEFFDNTYGLAKPLNAPAEPGDYEIVYVFSQIDGPEAVAARLPLKVGVGLDLEKASLSSQTLPNGAENNENDGHGFDGAKDGTAWTDYAYHCLENKLCEFRDETTGLTFTLPVGWVATAPTLTPMSAGAVAAGIQNKFPSMEFYQTDGNLGVMVLNPRQWIEDNGDCFATRAGDLCLLRNDAAPDDQAALNAVSMLQLTLTTGQNLRRCPYRKACDYRQPFPEISGKLPSNWSVEFFKTLPDGRLSTWFFDHDAPAELYKLVGLNQEGGDNCVEAAPDHLLCEFTPYISTQEIEEVRATLLLPTTRASVATPQGKKVDQAVIDQTLSIIRGK